MPVSEEAIAKAIEAVNGGMSKKKASTQFGVPRSTLRFRLSDKFVKSSRGPAPILSLKEEKKLVEWIANASKLGRHITKFMLTVSVQKFLKATQRPNPFTDDLPGLGWCKAFKMRNPEVAYREPEEVTRANACVSESDIRNWFVKIGETLEKEKWMDREMPNVYRSKVATNERRGSWNEAQLQDAVNAVKEKELGINQAAKTFGIPPSTLKNRLKNNNFSKAGLGPPCELGKVAERKIVFHIKKLQKHGFCPDSTQVREMAFRLAKQMGIRTKFNEEMQLAGYVWLQSFLRRNPDISLRKAEGVSIARAKGMNKTDCSNYFQLLEDTLIKNQLLDKPGNIFNMDETGLQLNNKPGKVLAAKGSKSVSCITSGEKGETVTAIVCSNGEGIFLPPYCIFKGKNRKDEWLEGMPPGTRIEMNEKSAYVTSIIFLDWLKNHFIPRKPKGKVLLLLDGHASHTSNIEMLTFAEENDIILLGFPPHTTHYLQPLDRAFFKSLKSYWYSACNTFMRTNPTRKLNRLVFGRLLGMSWEKACTVQTGISGFRATGVIPFNPLAIPDEAYLAEEQSLSQPINSVDLIPDDAVNTEPENAQAREVFNTEPANARAHENMHDTVNTGPAAVSVKTPKLTPGKLLDKISPIPDVNEKSLSNAKVRAKRVAEIFNSAENILKKSKLLKPKKPVKPATARKKLKFNLDDLGSSSGGEWAEEELSEEEENGDEGPQGPLLLPQAEKKIGEFVAFKYNNEIYAGKITVIEEDMVEISAFKHSKNLYRWPTPPDILKYSWTDVIGHVNPVPFSHTRQIYTIHELDRMH